MEIIKSKIDRSLLNKGHIDKDTCFFDIETTGFNRNTDIVYMVGILYFDISENSWLISQYFANSLKDEPKVLLESAKLLMSFERIINYNGNSFDIPFLNHKLKSFHLDIQIDKNKSLDLYSIIRKNKKLLDMDNLKLKTVERYLGIYREDIYSGKDCIDFYYDYILSGNLELKDILLSHNYDDLYFLIDIMDILDIIDDKRSFTIIRGDRKLSFFIEYIKESKTSLIFEGDIRGMTKKFIHYDRSFDILIDDTGTFKIKVDINKGYVSQDLIATYVDINTFNLANDLNIESIYNIPSNIYLLKLDSSYLFESILLFLKEIIEEVI